MTTTETNNSIKVSLQDLIAMQSYADLQTFAKRKKVSSLIAGEQRSKRFGHGMDFAEFRHYQAGDDIRSIDWRVTARSGKTHIRVYHEERERPVFIVIDQSLSMQFGTRVQFKSVLAAKMAAYFAWSAFKNNDRVGGEIIGIENKAIYLPRSGKRGVLQLFSGLSENYSPAVIDWDKVLPRLRQQIKPGSTLCLISDFYHISDNAKQHLQQLAQHNDIFMVHISDPLEQMAPPADTYVVTDGNQELILDTSSKKFCEAYAKQFTDQVTELKNFCGENKIDFRSMMTNDAF